MMAIVANELRRRFRDRSALVVAFVAPLALATVLGFAFRGAGSSLSVEVTPASSVSAARAVLGSGARVFAATSAAALHADVLAGRVDAAVDLAGSSPVVLVRADRPQAAAIGGALQATFSADGAPPGSVARISIHDETAPGSHGLVGYFAPSMAIVFLFFVASVGARSLLAEREAGTLVRLRAAPVRPTRILAAKMLAMYALAVASVAVLWGATVFAFGASWGGPLPVVLLSLATCLAMTGVGAIVTVFSRSAQEAVGVAGIVGFVLGLLGGNFFPPGSLPPFLVSVSRITPNGWALQAFGTLSLDHGHLGNVLTAILVLCAMGTAAMATAWAVVHRTVLA